MLLVFIVAIFIVLGAVYSITVPLWETPDEVHHFFFIKHLTEGKGLPVQRLETRGLWEQEGSQPPLYYALGAALTFWVDMSDAELLLWKNPLGNKGTPASLGNKNVFIHTYREAGPWHGTTLALHLLRGMSLLMGAGTVIAVYALARQVFPDERWLAVAATATCAFTPQFLFISAAVNNDNAATLLCTLVLWQLIYLLRRSGGLEEWRLATFQPSNPSTLQLTILGITLGLAALSKLSGLALLALTGVVLAWIAWRRRSLTWFIRTGIIVFGLAVTIAGWWYLRNWRLYNDFTGLRAMFEVVGRRHMPVNLQYLWGEFRGLRWSFWALFGWFSILLPIPAYYALDGVTLLALIGLVVWLARERSKTSIPISLIVPVLWLIMVFISLLRWTSLTPGTQGRLLFPAIGVIAILLVYGLSKLVPQPWSRVIVTTWCIALLSLAAWCPWGVIRPAYARPAAITEAEIPGHLPRLNLDYCDKKIRLLACELNRQVVQPGETINITLYWQALKPMDDDALMYIHLLGRGMELVGSLDSYPGWGTYPTSLWRPGEVLRDRYQVTISPSAQAPTLCRVDVGMTTQEQATGVSAGDDGSPVIFEGQFKLVPRKWPVAEGQRTDSRLGDQISLIGYAIAEETLTTDDNLHLTLYWRAEGPPEEDYTVFVHLLNTGGQRISGWDNPPLQNDYPTSAWDTGEVIADEYSVPVPAEAPSGEYTIAVGMYDAKTGERLPVTLSDGQQVPERWIILQKIRIEPQ